MREPIKPALSSEEWAQIDQLRWRDQSLPEKAIAVANDRLLADDPRKITRDQIDVALQAVDARWIQATADESGLAGMLLQAERFLRALESYLPPE